MSKKLVFTILFGTLFISLKAQYVLQEDFQQGIPGTWTLIDQDGRTPDSLLHLPSQVTSAWVALEDAGYPGDTIAISTSKYLPAGQADDWLISPPIVLGSGSFILTWNANAFAASGDGYEVRISTTTPTVSAFLSNSALFTVISENALWTKRSADLGSHQNQTVYIAFRNHSTDRFVLGIDDILLFDCNVLNADAGTIDTSTTTACSGFPALDLGLFPSYFSSTPTTVINGNSNDVPNWDPLAGRPFEDGGCCESPYSPPYQIVGFQVTVTGTYTVNQIQTGYDGFIYIYTDPLDLTVKVPRIPTGFYAGTTFIAGNDDGPGGVGTSEISGLQLTHGQNYYLISTGLDNPDYGDYTTTFTGPGSLLIQQQNADELPYDYNFVVSNSGGTIVSIGDDLTNTTLFPGAPAPAGATYNVCGISYVSANLDLDSYIGQPYSSLVSTVNSTSCAALTNECHPVVILSGSSTADAGVGDTLCAGGTVFLTASGGVSYEWSNGDTTATTEVAPLTTTVYTVTVTNNIGCTASDDVTVKIFSSDGGRFDATTTSACEGSSSLNLSLTPEFFTNFYQTSVNEISGTTLKYFSWDPLPGRPSTSGDTVTLFYPSYDIKPFRVDHSGLYSFTQAQAGYDGVIYVYTDPFDLAVNPPITFLAGSDDSITDIQLQPNVTYYLISAGYDAGQYGTYVTTVSGPGNLLLPGPPDPADFGYEYLALDSLGIIKAFTKDLSNPAVYPGSATGIDYQVCAVSYLRDSVNISLYLGQSFSSLSGVGCLDPSDNCHAVKIFTQPIADAGHDDTICNGILYTLSANVPPVGSGQWTSVPGTAFFVDSRSATSGVAGLTPGLNQLVWTINNGGCIDQDTVAIFTTVPTVDAGANDTICVGDSVTLIASGNGAIYWSTGDSAVTTVSPLVSTTYSVTVYDHDGCSASDNVFVKVNPLPIVNVPDASICVGSTTILDAGNPAASYVWSTGDLTQTISVNSPGTFSVTVTDINSCRNSDTATVSFGVGLTVLLNDVTLCEGDTVIFDAANPGTNYTWSTSDTTQTIAVTDAGTYSVTVVDANNCSGSDTATVTVVQLPPLSAGSDQTICEGDSTTLTALGAGTFIWSTGDPSTSILVIPVQDSTFSVTMTGGNSCTVTDDVIVSVAPLPNFDLGPDFNLCFGESHTLSASGGTQYLWSTGDTTSSIIVIPFTDTTYSVTASNAAGCSVSDDIIVTVIPSPTADAGVGDTLCAGETAMLTASGGGSYLWNTGSPTPMIHVSPTTGRYYYVTVTAGNGCTDTDSVYVKVNPVPGVDLGDDIDYCGVDSLEITASGGGTYLWSNGATTESIVVMPVANVTYSVTVTSDEGCVESDNVNVIIRPNPVADAGPDVTICEGEDATLTATGGPVYHWSNNSSSSVIVVSPSSTIDYSLTVTNIYGCVDFDEVTVIVNAVPDVILFGFDTSVYCLYGAPVFIGGTPTGGTLSGSGVNANTGQFIPANAGLGTHVILYSYTDLLNGCTGQDSAQIRVDLCDYISAIPNEQILIYPNPTEQYINIEMEGLLNEKATLRLIDPVGRIILERTFENEKMKIDLSGLAQGVYLLQIRQGQNLAVRQVVKN